VSSGRFENGANRPAWEHCVVARAREADELLLGEWACLAGVAQQPSHGFALAARLAPTGDLGRVWSLSRPLTYRSVEVLAQRGLVEVIGEERGRNGLPRTVYGATEAGREALARWLDEPVVHVRDAPTELLMKLVVLDQMGFDRQQLVDRQLAVLDPLVAPLTAPADDEHADPVRVWREESALATVRFLDRLSSVGASAHDGSPDDAS
jgi:DNA-binding PadR family transcriptional regulator